MEKIKKKMIKEKTNEKIQKLLIESVNLQKSGRLDELEKVLREITNIDSNYHPALFNLGRLSEKKKKYIKAIKFYKKTLKINPAHLDSMINLANCYEDINELDKAVKVLDKVCKLYPDKY